MMKISIYQQDIAWNDCETNIANASKALDSVPQSDIYVLPEMFSTGFCTEPEGIAESDGGRALAWMKEKSSQTGVAIAGSVAVEDNGKYFNRFYFVRPDGNVTEYDKRHLFTFGGEHNHFTPGNDRVIVCYKGVRILLETCYDLRFPVWSRNRKDYDMIIYVASWPTPRIEAWKALLTARAIENQCYVAGVNRTGADPSNVYCGASMVIDPYGNVTASCEDGKESVATAEIDMKLLQEFRRKFPVLDDADVI